MGIYDEQRMADLADYLADDDDCDDCDDCDDGPDWIPGCDSIANHCESYPLQLTDPAGAHAPALVR